VAFFLRVLNSAGGVASEAARVMALRQTEVNNFFLINLRTRSIAGIISVRGVDFMFRPAQGSP
jgi:hypothetical protein